MLAIELRESRNAISGALLMHGLMAAALFVSLQWSERTPVVQAELWSGMPRDLPARIDPPTPVAKPAPAPPPAPAPETKADIAIEKKKEEPKKIEPPKTEPKKEEPPKEDPRKEKERERQEAAKKAAEKRLAEKKLAEKKAAEQMEAQRNKEMASLLGSGADSKQSSTGKDTATKSGVVTGGAETGSKTGINADYIDLIHARIKNRINYFARANDNPEAIVEVSQLPSGEVVGVKLVRPSGMPAWDDAVQRAIWAASPLPKRKDGSVARVLELSFRPRENR